MSPLTIVAFVVIALAIKLSVLVALGVEVLRRAERWPVSGLWTLRGGGIDAIVPAERAPALPPMAQALLDFACRDRVGFAIVPSGATVTMRSEDGRVLSYGTPASRITRVLADGVEVQATWYRRGDVLCLESDAGAGAKITETYERVGSHLRAETRVVVPAYGLDRTRARVYERAASANGSRAEINR